MTACRRACRRGRPCRCARAAPRRHRHRHLVLSRHRPRLAGQLCRHPSRATAPASPVRLADSGQHGDETSFVDADTQAVAGQLNRTYVARQPSEGGPLNLRCWPQGTTSDISVEEDARTSWSTGSSRWHGCAAAAARRRRLRHRRRRPAMQAQQEDLGDLKLYRIPEPVTVAARSQKQVALLQRDDVQVAPGLSPARLCRRRRLSLAGAARPRHPQPHRRGARPAAAGRPAPALRSSGTRARCCSARARSRDRAVGEDVEIELGAAPGVIGRVERCSRQAEEAERLRADRHQRPRPSRSASKPRSTPRASMSPRRATGSRAQRHAALGGDGAGQRQRDAALPRRRDR